MGPTDARLMEAQTAFEEARTLHKAGKYAEATTKGRHALELREAVLGGTHPEVAACLTLVGDLYRLQGDFAQARPLIERALAIRETALGEHHPDVAQTLNTLAILYWVQGLYGQAEPLYQRSLAIREAAFGEHHPKVAETLCNLALLYKGQGLYERAEPLFQRALAIYEAAVGRDHPDIARLLINLAGLYWAQGLYDRVGPLYQRSLDIAEATLGKHHPLAIQALNGLANVYQAQGLYDQAEPLLQQALAVHEATLGPHAPEVTGLLLGLAIIYWEQGLYSRAEPLYQRALAIREATFGENHPQVAHARNGLATFYAAQGLYGQAESLYQRVLATREATLGEHHPDVAETLGNLANIYTLQGLYGRAEPLFQRALAIEEAALGEHHPQLANSLHSLATLYLEQGLYGRAEPLFQRALAMREAPFGVNHPVIAETLTELARLRLAQHRVDDAVRLLARALSLSELRLRREALGFSESRLASFLQFLRADEERLYALLRAHPRNPLVQRLVLSAVLLRKGRSVEETSHTSRTILRGLDPQARGTFERLRGLRAQLAALSLQGPGSLPPADHQQRLKALADQGDALEADLARLSAPLRALASLPAPNEIVDRVAAALPKDGALVEFVAYADRPLVPRPGTPISKSRSQLRYLALVLLPDARIRTLDLGPAAPIDQAASRLRDAFADRNAAHARTAQALYALAFKPLLPLLGSARRLFLAPDGQLALVPFSALHDGKAFLIDSFDFSYLTSGKDLLPRTQDIPSPGSVVVLADPAFDSLPAATPSAPLEVSALSQRSSPLERFSSLLRTDLAESTWAPLPGTRQEAEAIQRVFPQAQLFLGPDASKQRLLQLQAPSVLHIATHGFFLKDPSLSSGSRGIGHVGSSGGAPAQPPPDPLLRSGLVLTGAHAQAPTPTGAAESSSDNFLVTAFELAGLDLWGTQLAVLSACDTGRGDIKLGQGVYGLRRALIIAGAETVVMSLWKVNDDSTRVLMESFYRNLLAGMGRAAALRDAMRSLRQTHPHPYYWAPFIALGSDAPLRLPDSPAPPLGAGRNR
jgi:CHAT domain-containing protein/Tfp pilus assembly protein PilF